MKTLNTIDDVLSGLVIALHINNKTDKKLIEGGLKIAFALGEIKTLKEQTERS